MGLPLTIEPHDSHHVSFLNTEKVELRGMVNLLVLLLMSYHLRAMVDRFANEQTLSLDLVSPSENIKLFFDSSIDVT